jgi:TMEM175 potassium channel family protein
MAEENPNARLIALTDGVLAIAMTLLILDVRLPQSAATLDNAALWQALLDIQPQIYSYGLSFIVIAILWLTHVQKFRHVRRSSPILTWLHILFLLLVGFVPFTTSVLAENGNAVSTAVYAVVMATASLLLGSMSVHARRRGLTDDDTGRNGLLAVALTQFGTAAVFYASAAFAFISPDGAKYLWLLLVPLGFIRDRQRRVAGGKTGGD